MSLSTKAVVHVDVPAPSFDSDTNKKHIHAPLTINPSLDRVVGKAADLIDPVTEIVEATAADIPEGAKEEIIRSSVTEFLAHNRKFPETSAQYLANLDVKRSCTFHVTMGQVPIPIQRTFYVETRDKTTGQEVTICYDLQDLNRAFSTANSKYVPNVAKLAGFKVSAQERERYHLNFDFFSPSISGSILSHVKQFQEIETNRTLVASNMMTDFMERVIAPVLQILVSYVGGLFEQLFPSVLVKLGRAIVKGTSKLIHVVPGVAWAIQRIWGSAQMLARYVFNNPLIVNFAIYLLTIIKIVWCVWYQGPTIGIESLRRWVETHVEAAKSSVVWRAVWEFAKTLVACATGDIFRCVVNSLKSVLLNLFHLKKETIDSIFSVKALSFLGHGVLQFVTSLFSGNSAGLRKEITGFINLDYGLFVQSFPILLPKLVGLFLNLIPLPRFLVQTRGNAIQLLELSAGWHGFLNNYIAFFWDILTTLWYCARGSKECCYPASLKEEYAASLKPRTWLGKSLGYVQSLLFSDERIKEHLSTTDLVIQGLRFHRYMLRTDFIRQLRLQNKKRLPPWVRSLQKNPAFWSQQIFYGLSAQEVEAQFPEAVQSYCFPTKTHSMPRCAKYLVLDRLPQEVHHALVQLNPSLFV